MASNEMLASLRADCGPCRAITPLTKRNIALLAMMTVWALVAASPASGQLLSSLGGSNKGTGRKAERTNAIAAIPFSKLTPKSARQIEEVVTSPSIYRKLPIQSIQCDRDFFVFMVRNPEAIVHTWQLMGITALTLDRTGPYRFASSDGAGTDSQVELVYGTPNLHVYYGSGVYEGPLFKRTMTGQCVIVLRSDYDQQGGRPLVNCRMDVFIRMPQSAVDVAAKTLNPLFGKAADINFAETAKFFQRLNMAATRDARSIERLANRLDEVSPDVRQQMIQIAQATEQRWGTPSEQAAQATASGPRRQSQGRHSPVQRVSGASSSRHGQVQHISRHPPSSPRLR